MSKSKYLTPKKILRMIMSNRGLHIVSFLSSILIFAFTFYMAILISFDKFSKEAFESWDLFFLISALLTYILDTFGVIEKKPKAINIVRSVTLVSILIPLLSKAVKADVLINHYIISVILVFLVVILCYVWMAKHIYKSINALGEKTAKEEARKVQEIKDKR